MRLFLGRRFAPRFEEFWYNSFPSRDKSQTRIIIAMKLNNRAMRLKGEIQSQMFCCWIMWQWSKKKILIELIVVATRKNKIFYFAIDWIDIWRSLASAIKHLIGTFYIFDKVGAYFNCLNSLANSSIDLR